jgi:hypothetical protein
MTVNVLGTDYTVEKFKRADDECLCDCDGYCDKTSKRIVVAEKDSVCNLDDFEHHQKKVLRHEIVHAFMFESGLAENWEHKNIGQEETVVDWFAIQGLKIYNAWKQADCI